MIFRAKASAPCQPTTVQPQMSALPHDRILHQPRQRSIGAPLVGGKYIPAQDRALPAPQSGLWRRRLCFQANGLPHTSPGQAPWVHGSVSPSQANGLIHSFQTVGLGMDGG